MRPHLMFALLVAAFGLAACDSQSDVSPASDAAVDTAAATPAPPAVAASMPAAPASTTADAARADAPSAMVAESDETNATSLAAIATPEMAVIGAMPAQPARSAASDPASIPESTATLPPFPLFETPEGLVSTLSEDERNSPFDREHMISGDKIVAVEGKVFRDRFKLANSDGREYSAIEFQRNYSDAIARLGGVEVSDVQYTREVNNAFGGRKKVDRHYHGTCASDGCENHTYLIRQDGREYWIQVSTGAIPLHGAVVVLERQGMTSKLGFLDADVMKQKLDADGRVALYVNFDTDKATLRPDAMAVIDEITRLLEGNPGLKLSIDGHTDNTGDAAHNLALSRARAESVRNALLAKDIAPERLETRGFGAEKPLADNDSEEGRAKNRRVELVKL